MIGRRIAVAVAVMFVLALCVTAATPMIAAGVVVAEPKSATPLVRGYPIILASGAGGAVWYGGVATGGLETVESLGYISPSGAFADFPFNAELEGRWPEYLTLSANGDEWFLAYKYRDPLPLLGEASPLGTISVQHLAVSPQSEVHGLAVGADGDLWMTDTSLQGHTRLGAILRVTPTGSVTAFSKGLEKSAIPWYITAGSGNVLWFTDSAGRVGRIDTSGAIREFPVVRHTVPGRFQGPESPIVIGPDRDLWFILKQHIGRMTLSGHVKIFTPQSSYRQPEAWRGLGGLDGLATGPEGDLWFTRVSGEVARMDGQGHVTTVTDRLVSALGIAFGSDGVAWVGEGIEGSRSARIARIGAEGTVTQYPPISSRCRVPYVLGDGPYHAAENIRSAECEFGGARRPHGSRSNRLIVVSQSMPPGTVASYKEPVSVVLGPRPPAPKMCRAPRYDHVLARSTGVVVWMNTFEELDSAQRLGEGGGDVEQSYFACVPPYGVKHRFYEEEGGEADPDFLKTLHAAGHFVDFINTIVDKYSGDRSETLTVFDAERGHNVFTKTYEEISESTSDVGFGAYALSAHGEIAWVKRELRDGLHGYVDTLDIHDRWGTHAVETGADIADLSFDGYRLTWKTRGERRERMFG